MFIIDKPYVCKRFRIILQIIFTFTLPIKIIMLILPLQIRRNQFADIIAGYINMSDNIKHSGIIETIEEGHICVRILQASACGQCVVSSHCHASGAKEKLIDVYETPTKNRKKGDQVTVVASTKTGARAVMLGFGVPFILLLAVLFTTMGLTGSEPIAAITALCSLIPYYILLYSLREKIRGKITFWIE